MLHREGDALRETLPDAVMPCQPYPVIYFWVTRKSPRSGGLAGLARGRLLVQADLVDEGGHVLTACGRAMLVPGGGEGIVLALHQDLHALADNLMSRDTPLLPSGSGPSLAAIRANTLSRTVFFTSIGQR